MIILKVTDPRHIRNFTKLREIVMKFCEIVTCVLSDTVDTGNNDFTAYTVFQTANTCLNTSISTCPIATYISLDANSGIHVAIECLIRAPHPQMGRSDWTLLTTSVSPLAFSDMYVAIGHVLILI
jgi:hypothetical protein